MPFMPKKPVLLIALGLSLAAPSPAWARAGGGGGFGGFGGGGGGAGPYGSGGVPTAAALWVLVPVLLLGLCLVFLPDAARRYSRLRETFTERRLRALRPATRTNVALLKARARNCFFPVQRSWSTRDVSASRAFVSDALYERHRAQLEEMKRRGRANRIKDLVLNDIRIVRIEEGSDGKVARFAARIEATARDWVADLRRGVVVAGDAIEKRRFVEYWSFCRDPGQGWVLDEIRRLDWRLPRRPR